eukprot:4102288-Pleurochrysis_carterae.AAC.1
MKRDGKVTEQEAKHAATSFSSTNSVEIQGKGSKVGPWLCSTRVKLNRSSGRLKYNQGLAFGKLSEVET